MTETVQFRARVFGRVQGVSYRAWVCEAARSRGLNGWAKNSSSAEATTHLPPHRAGGAW